MAYDDEDITAYRQEYADDTAEWQPIRDEATIDMRHVAGDPWDPNERAAREIAMRPIVTTDELGQYTNQVINEVRSNKRAVKFTPIGDGANDASAKFYEEKMREIEYRSKAQIAYTTAFQNAVERSYGFCRVTTRYEHARSVNQDIWIDPVHNPDWVTPDPYAVMPTMSDMQRCWVREPWRTDQFNKRWPDAKLEGRALTQFAVECSTWITTNIVWVAERWTIKTKARTLLIVQPAAPQQAMQPGAVLNLQQQSQQQAPEPFGVFDDEYKPEMGKVITTRDVDDPYVKQCLTNGVEILEETDWPGKYIPIIACLGKILYVDDGMGSTRQIHSLVRPAREAFMAYCFYRTCELENVGMTTKNPYWAYKGQLDPAQKQEIAKSMHEPVAVLEANPRVEGVTDLLPLPQRNVSEPAIQALSLGAEEMRRAIQAAIGQSPLPTMAQRRNEKSGVALKHIEETGQRGSFHFTDHYLDMIQHVGVVVEDLMDHIYDAPRDVGIRKANDTAEIIRINDPKSKNPVMTKGDHLVTVSTGPSFESEREAASDFADTLAQVSPEVFAILGPLIVKLKNLGPIGDEMVELLEAVQPPPIQQLKAAKKQQNGQNDPMAAMAELQQTKAQLQQVMAAASKMQHDLETDAAKQQVTLQKAQIDSQTALQKADKDAQLQILLQEMKNAAAIRIAEVAAEAKGVATSLQETAAHEALALNHAHESHEAAIDRQHEQDIAQQQHDAALLQAEHGASA
jgi:hypothetical protein